MVATKASHIRARVTEGSYKEDVGQAWSLCMVHTLLPAHLEMSATKFSFSKGKIPTLNSVNSVKYFEQALYGKWIFTLL